MKNQQRQQARDLYFQAALTKTAIAEQLGVSRRTIHQWSVDGNWEKLSQSARNMPSILAEKCYYLIGHLADHLLQKDSCYETVTSKDVNMLYKLAATVSKLKQGSTVSENMETFTYFLERMRKTDAALAEKVAPHVTGYIEARRGINESDFLLHGFDDDGYLYGSEEELMEKERDEADAKAMPPHMPETRNTKASATLPQTSLAAAPPAVGSNTKEPSKPVTFVKPPVRFGSYVRHSKKPAAVGSAKVQNAVS
ncbi:MAG: hypothetical protein V4649_11365 [Bacteroidota bacterium]